VHAAPTGHYALVGNLLQRPPDLLPDTRPGLRRELFSDSGMVENPRLQASPWVW
jgi:hypothetical protein